MTALRTVCGVICLLVMLGAGRPVLAQAPARPPAGAAALAEGLSGAQVQQVLDVLQNDARRAQFVATLQAMAKAMAASGATPPSPAAPAVVAVAVAPNSLGAQIAEGVAERLEAAEVTLVATFRAVSDYGLLVRWWTLLIGDPDARAQLLDFAWKLLVLAGLAGLAEALVIRALRRPRRAVDRNRRGLLHLRAPTPHAAASADDSAAADHALADAPTADEATADEPTADEIGDEEGSADDSPAEGPAGGRPARPRPSAAAMLRRIPLVLLRLLLDLIPVAAFGGVAIALLATPLGTPSNTRMMILALVNAYLVLRLILCATRMLVSPASPLLRLVHISNQRARFVMRWTRRIAGVATFGYGATEAAIPLGLYPAAQEAILKMVALVAHAMLVIVVLESRAAVAAWLRAPPGKRGAIAVLRNALAVRWHFIAIFYIVALWLVWALEVADGFTKLLHFFIVTAATLAATRVVSIVLVGALDRAMRIDPARAQRHPGLEARAGRYHPILRAVLNTGILLAAMLVLFQLWGLQPLVWFQAGALGGQLVSAGTTSTLTLLIAMAVWEGTNAAIERRLALLASAGDAARAARLRTLMPMLRTSLVITLWLIAGLMILSQIGINIAPLLAGAGVVGVAVGFGSQKLVQDIITGMFLLLENTMQVGDTVALASLTGTIETLSVRTIRLRALDGSVHIIPFSAVTTVTNMTRDFSYAVIDIESGFNEEPDVIAAVLRDIAAEMRAEEAWCDALRDDLEVLGVDRFLENAWVLRVRIKTQPTKRWAVQREINRRVKYRFDQLAIESPFTSYRVLCTTPPPRAPTRPASRADAAALPGQSLPIGQETPH